MTNNEKSDFNFKTKKKWLDKIIDTRKTELLQFHNKKITKLLEDIGKYLNQEFLTPKHLSKVARQLSSIHLAIGPSIPLFTRKTFHFIENRVFW